MDFIINSAVERTFWSDTKMVSNDVHCSLMSYTRTDETQRQRIFHRKVYTFILEPSPKDNYDCFSLSRFLPPPRDEQKGPHYLSFLDLPVLFSVFSHFFVSKWCVMKSLCLFLTRCQRPIWSDLTITFIAWNYKHPQRWIRVYHL